MFKKLELKGEIDKSTIIIRDLRTPPPLVYRIIRQKINKDIKEVNSTINKAVIICICRTAKYMLFSSAHGIFTKTDHILGHKISLSKCKRIQSMFSKQNGIKLEINK